PGNGRACAHRRIGRRGAGAGRHPSRAPGASGRPVIAAPPMSAIGTVLLKPGKERSLARRHPWVYAGAVNSVTGAPGNGALVAVRASDGRFLAWAAYSPVSAIRARCWSFDESDQINADWFAAKLDAAV